MKIFVYVSCGTSARFQLMASSYEALPSHSSDHHTRHDSSRWGISPTQKTLPDNTQQSQETNILTTGGIRTHSPSKRVP